MTLFFLLNPRSKLNLLSVMNQSYGDSIERRKKRKYDNEKDELAPEVQTEELNDNLNKYADITRDIETWEARVAAGIKIQQLEDAAKEELTRLSQARIKLAMLILEMEEEEHLLAMLLLH